ncbi:hypothetical protein BDV10DRAFT_168104 [Aspergillus recurvatus]
MLPRTLLLISLTLEDKHTSIRCRIDIVFPKQDRLYSLVMVLVNSAHCDAQISVYHTRRLRLAPVQNRVAAVLHIIVALSFFGLTVDLTTVVDSAADLESDGSIILVTAFSKP